MTGQGLAERARDRAWLEFDKTKRDLVVPIGVSVGIWNLRTSLSHCFCPRSPIDAALGMARGKKMGRATAARTEREEASSEDSSDEEEVKAKPKLAQRATAGQLPPSDSDSESEEEAPKKGPCGKQPATAGTLPPNSDDEEEESDDEESDDEDGAAPR